MAEGHGGARIGAGRRRRAVKHARPIADAEPHQHDVDGEITAILAELTPATRAVWRPAA